MHGHDAESTKDQLLTAKSCHQMILHGLNDIVTSRLTGAANPCLGIVRSRQRIRPIKVQQVRNAAQDTLLYTGAASEAKVMQAAAKQRVAGPSFHTLLKSCLYTVPCSSTKGGNCRGIPVQQNVGTV